jgi:hypothetical protein
MEEAVALQFNGHKWEREKSKGKSAPMRMRNWSASGFG